MLLLENSQKVRITFDDKEDNFKYFARLFQGLSKFDEVTSIYITDMKKERTKVQSSVNMISKNSPTLIEVFTSPQWLEIFMFILASYPEQQNTGDIQFRSLVNFSQSANQALIEFGYKGKSISEEELKNVYDWFNGMSTSQKFDLMLKLRGTYKIINYLKNIFF
ncbi:hypothetical protein N9E11_01550 [Crocinitomicaceae bacterium]|nr:hypothetical protein [Crocinitomicaceae bacterium]